MITTAFFSDILTIVFSGLIVFFIIFYFLKDGGYINIAGKRSQESLAHMLPLRLQAYERLVLFVERINPSSMLLRLHAQGMSARELQSLVLSEIRSEFQHNITQQIYVGSAAWLAVRKIKDDTLILVSSTVSALPTDATAADLSRTILTHLSSLDTDPYESALAALKDDMKKYV